MSYPTLPFPLVHFLAEITPQRASLVQGPRHITIVATKDLTASSERVEITTDAHFLAVDNSINRLMLKENVDTLTLLYSTPEDPKVDVGIILEKGKEPMAIEWTHSPHFILRLITAEETKTVLLGNAGVRTVLKHFED